MRKKVKTIRCLFFCLLCLEDWSATWSVLPKEKYVHEILLWKFVAFNKKVFSFLILQPMTFPRNVPI